MDLRGGQNTSEEAVARATPGGEVNPPTALADAGRRIAELEVELKGQARARAELVNLVCHELRTPITVISGFARLLQNEVSGPLNDEQHRFVNEGLRACRRLDQFVDDLLEARPDAQTPFSVVPSEADLHDTIGCQLESLAPMLEERGIKVEASLHCDDPVFDFDERRIEQVITNLLTNAIRHGRECGVIRLETRSSGPESTGSPRAAVEVSVEDDGQGVPAPDRERIFAPYVRGESSKKTAGLGIGLAICRRIVDAHGGEIWVEAGELGGARFAFHLPREGCAAREE
jgi:signal transduction histidine kinase